MNSERQRIVIAESLGWKRCYANPACPDQMLGWLGSDWKCVPDYLNDLNAMHEAENSLTRSQCITYTITLGKLSPSRKTDAVRATFEMMTASAELRAEAFLKTIGKWEP